MRKIFTLLTAAMALFSTMNAQTIGVNNIVVSPATPTICDQVTITVSGFFACANWSVLSSNSSYTGNQLLAELYIDEPQICLPAIVPFSTVINLGALPENTYSAGLRYYVGGVLNQTVPFNLSVGGLSASTTNVTSSTATLNWTNLSCGCEYEIEGGVQGLPYINLFVPQGTSSFNVSGLNPSTAYEWRVRSVCTNDTTAWSSLKTFTTTGCFPPTSLSTFAVTSTTATLIWAGSADAAVYQIYGRPQGSSSIVSINVNAPTTAFSVSGLVGGTTYEWAMRTVCTSGFVSAFSPINTFTTPPSPGISGKSFAASANLSADLFPNPANAYLDVAIQGTDYVEVLIVNAAGQKVYQRQHHTGSGQVRLATDQFATGVYHMLLMHAEGRIVKRFLVSR